MPNPFPGMNPYLEQPEFWSDFHNHLIAALARVLIPTLLPTYRVVIDKWVYKIADSAAIAIGRPDVAVQQSRTNPTPVKSAVAASQTVVQPIKVTLLMPEEVQQAYLEVRDAATQTVITAIEVLSPANKRGDGRQKYELKRQHVLESLTNLVEIDLLRSGSPLPLEDDTIQNHYRILVSRANTRPIADLYSFNLSDRIPLFPLPLKSEDSEPMVDLQQLVNDLYEQLGYDYFIDYRSNPPLPWLESDVANVLLDRRR
ncbi:MAG: DUF4058 family protein [Leptolyngbyaceae cyanobacterium RU_5_1]|nr:DUF4058 family protein [Leptolyngbyaceae cyanobacterium RU_5_1]